MWSGITRVASGSSEWTQADQSMNDKRWVEAIDLFCSSPREIMVVKSDMLIVLYLTTNKQECSFKNDFILCPLHKSNENHWNISGSAIVPLAPVHVEPSSRHQDFSHGSINPPTLSNHPPSLLLLCVSLRPGGRYSSSLIRFFSLWLSFFMKANRASSKQQQSFPNHSLMGVFTEYVHSQFLPHFLRSILSFFF